MERGKLKIEIYEGDPFEGACCGPPRISSPQAAEKLRNMLTERSQIVKRLQSEFRDKIDVKRDIISAKRWDYPGYVMKLRIDNKPLPYIFLNGEPIVIGKFPSYEEFVALLKSHYPDIT